MRTTRYQWTLSALTAAAMLLVSCEHEKVVTEECEVCKAPDGIDTTIGTPDVGDTGQPDSNVDTATPPDTSDPGDTTPPEDIVITEGGFLWPCQGNSDCLDGFCVEGEEGFFCTKTCIEECPAGMDCKSVVTGSSDPAFLCLPRLKKVCVPCATDFQCTGGACLDIDGENYCATTCESDEECPESYACNADPSGERDGTFCQPKSGSCDCTPDFSGALRTCLVENAIGTCFGVETCEPDQGWIDCTAPPATDEVCDGLDNNCDGLVDNGVVDGGACSKVVPGVGTCTGTEICVGGQGFVCNAQDPEVETCDFIDNNCDGRIDEDFRAGGTGAYNTPEHCGSCGASCNITVPNAVTACVIDGDDASCQVTSCADGFYQAGPLTCLPVSDDLCAPCSGDDSCQTPGDRCLNIDGGSFCAKDCSEGNLHGLPAGQCPGGYSCVNMGSGIRQCQPTSGSCTCLAQNDGTSRTCLRTNATGTCFGQQTCNAAAGWSVCSALEPAAELCDDLDNDCNQIVDDVPNRGAACANTNANGSCTGLFDCVDGQSDLVCVADIPAPDICNYIDDDCDGTTDNNYPNLFATCSVGEGLCQRFGFNECRANGAGIECNVQPGIPQTEICDGIDNDCDGQVDEGPVFGQKGQPCTAGVGVCEVTGVLECATGGQSLTCSATPPTPGNSDPCDGLDNDCDGQIDENFPTKGDLCSAGTGVCASFGNFVCNAAGTGVTCNATAGAPQTEVCDLVDNDCDGVVDDGFIINGKYSRADACGNCFTDCGDIFDRPNGYGTCNATGAPTCELTCCRAGDSNAACDGNDYFDLNGVPDDGCELGLNDAVHVSESDVNAFDNPGCGLGPANTLPGYYPCKSITYGIGRAQALNRDEVRVAGGAYNENVNVVSGISLFGGYNPTTWDRAPASNLTAIFDPGGSGDRKTMVAQNITAQTTTVDGFTVYGGVASGASRNSYAIYVRNSNNRLQLTNNIVWGGTGGPGSIGATGSDGSDGGDGNDGVGAFEPTQPFACAEECEAAGASSPGGTGGVNGSCGNARGGNGGGADCPDFNESHNQCTDPTNDTIGSDQTVTTSGFNGQGSGAGAGGLGGCDTKINPDASNSCTCLQPGCAQGKFSAPGTNGSPGNAGSGGIGGIGSGGVVAAEWRGVSGFNGTSGGSGSGGGGGGAGGGVETRFNISCSGYSDFGGTGGGGGAGGCGGSGGTGGGSGGGAFGIFVVFNTAPGSSIPTISGNEIHTGFGGLGGRGGNGGTAGAGGNGGVGGNGGISGSSFWCAAPGSKGGEGGAGGPGGGGGGGSGGISYGIYVSGQGGSSVFAWTANTITLDGAGGTGGAGGGTGAGGNVGNSGATGAQATRNF